MYRVGIKLVSTVPFHGVSEGFILNGGRTGFSGRIRVLEEGVCRKGVSESRHMRSQLPLCQKPRLGWCAATSGVVCCHIWGVLPVRSFMRRSLFLSVERPFTSQTVFFGDRASGLRKTLTLPETSTVWTVGMSGCFLGQSCAKAALEIMLSLFAAGSHQPLQHQPPESRCPGWTFWVLRTLCLRCSPLRGPGCRNYIRSQGIYL